MKSKYIKAGYGVSIRSDGKAFIVRLFETTQKSNISTQSPTTTSTNEFVKSNKIDCGNYSQLPNVAQNIFRIVGGNEAISHRFFIFFILYDFQLQ